MTWRAPKTRATIQEVDVYTHPLRRWIDNLTQPHKVDEQPDLNLVASLRRAGLIDDENSAHFEQLTGGVSSDIWKIETPARTFCVKRALLKLKVAADWQAPVERNRYEVAWYQTVRALLPEAAPEVLHHDEREMLFAMGYFDPREYGLWKTELRDGRADETAAAAVGRCLGIIHAATARDSAVAERFPENDIFHAIRLEPYLEATAVAHPDLSERLLALSRRTGENRLAMIHGDVSPKNILIGPRGPVFLDAECACIGDPAFDVAFCLNHLLLKCLWNPSARAGFVACFRALTSAYLAQVDWEPVAALEARVASLLPGLLLARVDGKSPVEYLNDERQFNHVRRCARVLLTAPPAQLETVVDAWELELHA
jgi:aminoglycoside phosphotransferase (APT) family kinase protein